MPVINEINATTFTFKLHQLIDHFNIALFQISQWVTDFAAEQPLASEVLIGESYEKRPIKAVKVCCFTGDHQALYLLSLQNQ